MIDTIKLSVFREFNKTFYNLLLYRSKNRVSGHIINSHTGIVEKTDLFVYNSTNYENYESFVINGSFIPSHDYNINYRVFEDRIDLEFSLPKFIYGTNCLQLLDHISRFASPYQMLKRAIKKFFDECFSGCLINYGAVEIKRWDFCFNQFFENETKVYECLKYIKLKYASKHDKLSYETGLVELTKSNYLKIYMKGVEFEKHDKKKFKHAHLFETFSKQILRFEKKCTNKNISYWFNSNVLYNNVTFNEFKRLRNLFNKNKVEKVYRNSFKGKFEDFKDMRSIYEKVQNFTLGKPLLRGYIQMDETTFNHLYTMFRDEIKQKFDISKYSIDKFKKEVISGDKKNKVLKVKILALIKTFKSLKRAYESGAITKPTYYRYKNFLNENNMNEINTREKTDIKQDWTNESYYNYLLRNNIEINSFINDLRF